MIIHVKKHVYLGGILGLFLLTRVEKSTGGDSLMVEGSLRDPQKRSLRDPEKGWLRYPQTHDMQVLRVPFCREDIYIYIYYNFLPCHGKDEVSEVPKE